MTNIGSSRHHECEGRHTSCELFIGHNVASGAIAYPRSWSSLGRLAISKVAVRTPTSPARTAPVMDLSVETTDKRDRSLPVAGFKGAPEEIERQWYEQVYRGQGDSMARLTWRAVLIEPLSWPACCRVVAYAFRLQRRTAGLAPVPFVT